MFLSAEHSAKTEMHPEGCAAPCNSPRGQAVAALPRSQQAGTPAAAAAAGLSPRAVTRAGGGSAQTAPGPRRQLQPSLGRKAQDSRSPTPAR